MITLLTPKNKSTVSLLTNTQKQFLDGSPLVLDSEKDSSIPQPVNFTFSPALSGTLILMKTSDGSSRSYNAKNGVAQVYNLHIGEEYTWKIRAGLMESDTFSFSTEAQPPRLIFADGISNMRDVGGYTLSDGKRLRQGLLYRSSEMDSHFSLSQSGKTTLLCELGIKSDMDLRGINGEKASSALNGEVRYLNFPLAAYGDIFTDTQKALYKDVFNVLSNKETYPAVIHCWSGADRTGTLCYVLGALLGVDEGELELDYELSSLSVCGERSVTSSDFARFKEIFFSYGASAKAAAEAFLYDCGVNDTAIKSIRGIFLDC